MMKWQGHPDRLGWKRLVIKHQILLYILQCQKCIKLSNTRKMSGVNVWHQPMQCTIREIPQKYYTFAFIWSLQKWIYSNDHRMLNFENRKCVASYWYCGTIIFSKKMASLKLAKLVSRCRAREFSTRENQPKKPDLRKRGSFCKILKNVKFLLVGNLKKWA